MIRRRGRTVMEPPPILVSVFYFVFVLLICEIGRSLNKAFVRDDSTRSLIEELIGTTQLCAFLFENSFIFGRFGYTGFMVVIFCSFIVNCYTLRSADANPCPSFEKFAYGVISSSEFVSRISCQLAGAFLSFRLANLFWTLDMIEDHRRAYEKFHCISDLNVSVLVGVNLEMVATAVYRFLSLKFDDQFSQKKATILSAILVVILVVAGLPYTGMYFNPIMATSNNYGCRDVATLDHLFVYWVGPIVGWMLATRFYRATKDVPV